MNSIVLQKMFLPIIIYVVVALALYFILKTLKCELPWFAFIPFYGNYVVYKEYSKRIFKKKWHIIYLVSLGLYLATTITAMYYISTLFGDATIENIIIPISIYIDEVEILFALYSANAIVMLLMQIVLFYPILYKDKYKISFILLVVLSQSAKIVVQIVTSAGEMNLLNKNFYTIAVVQILFNYFDIVLAFFVLIVAAKVYNEVKHKRMELREGIEKGNFSLVK